jgi:hypothetical protein
LKKEWLSALKPFLRGAKKDEYIPSISGYKDRVLDWKCKEKSEIRLKLKAERLKRNEVKHDLNKK